MIAASSSVVCGAPHVLTSRCLTSSRSVRRTALARPVVMIGQVNDPERTKAQKEKKATDSPWAEPKNKNPLEKVTLMRDNPEGPTDSQKADRDVAAEEIKQKGIGGLSGAQKKVDEAVEGIKDALTGDK